MTRTPGSLALSALVFLVGSALLPLPQASSSYSAPAVPQPAATCRSTASRCG